MAKKLISYDDAAEGLGLPEVVEEVLNDTYLLKGEMPTIPDVVDPPINTGILGGLSLLGDSTGRGTYSGDSEPGIGDITVKANSMSWLTWASHLSRGRLNRGVNASIIGNTISQMLARIETDIINHPLQVGTAVAVCSGYNDAFYGVSTTAYMDVFSQIHQRLSQAQIEMIACTPLPTENDPAINAQMGDYSEAIREYARRHGLFLLDLRELTIDPATGGLIPEVKTDGDGVHPGAAGQAALGGIVLDQLRNRLARFGAHPTDLWGDKGNLTTNRTFEGEPDERGRPPSVFVSGSGNDAVVPTVVPGEGLIDGNWFRITHTAATGEVVYATRITAAGKIEPGDRIAIAGIVSATGDMQRFAVGPEWYRAPFHEAAFRSVNGVEFDPVPFYCEFTVPAAWSMDYLDILIRSGSTSAESTGHVDVAQLGVYNLTKIPALAG